MKFPGGFDMQSMMKQAQQMQEEMAKLNTTAKGGSIDALKAQAGEVGKACKACHDNYRKE